MGRLILVDTSILIKAQHDREFASLLNNYEHDMLISRITAGEMIVGSRDSREKKLNKLATTILPVIEVNESISSYAYKLIDRYSLKVNLGILDALIAATAIVEDIELWTLNIKHFGHIKEVKLFEFR